MKCLSWLNITEYTKLSNIWARAIFVITHRNINHSRGSPFGLQRVYSQSMHY